MLQGLEELRGHVPMTMRRLECFLVLVLLAMTATAQPVRKPPCNPSRPIDPKSRFFGFRVQKFNGSVESLARYRGCVCLVAKITVDSRKDENPEDVQQLKFLQERYRDRGFYVLAFPESSGEGSRASEQPAIERWRERHGVNFPTFAPIRMKGPHVHPVYRFLNESVPHGTAGSYPNYLIDRQGRVAARFDSEDPDPANAVAIRRGVESALQTVLRPDPGSDPTAEALEAALWRAHVLKKNVIVVFLARGEAASRKLRRFLDMPGVMCIVDQNYVRLDLLVPESDGAELWLAICAEGRFAKPSFIVWLSPVGRILDSTFDGSRCIGFPSSRRDVARFIRGFGRTARNVTPGQLDRLVKAFAEADRESWQAPDREPHCEKCRLEEARESTRVID